MSTIAVYSGTFDPITLGHEDVARRAAGMFGTLIIAVAAAHHKKTLFNHNVRMQRSSDALQNIANVQVLPFDGLMVDFCAKHGASVIVRGIRNMADFDYEAQMAAMNRKMNPNIETVFLLPSAPLQCISSTLVREISKLGGSVADMVNPEVVRALADAHRPPRLEA